MSLHEHAADPTAAIRALMSDEDRRLMSVMEKVRRVHVVTARDTVMDDHYRTLMRKLCQRVDYETPHERAERLEGNMVVVLGPSGAGKSTVIDHCLRESPLCPHYGEPDMALRCPIVRVVAPSPCGSVELGREVLARTGWTVERKNVHGPEVWRMVRERLRELGKLVVSINEMQHVPQSANVNVQAEVRNALKGLMANPDHPMGLIIAGMPETEHFLCPPHELRSNYQQVPRRGGWMSVDPLTMPDDSALVAATLEEMADVADLKVTEDVKAKIVPRLVHAGQNLLGITCTEIHGAIEAALKKNSPTVGLAEFAEAYAFRTGSLPNWNPYLADNFRAVVASRVLARSDPPLQEVVSNTKKKKAR